MCLHTQQHDDDVSMSILVYFSQPRPSIVETFTIGNIVQKEESYVIVKQFM